MTAVATSPRERPILFSAPMVRAILDGCKTQTRRVVLRHGVDEGERVTVRPGDGYAAESVLRQFRAPYEPGDLLWVRESACIAPPGFGYTELSDIRDDAGRQRIVQFVATHPDTGYAHDYGIKVTPSIHMPRWASRLTLRVTDVRVERVQDISEAAAEAEGLTKRGRWWDVGADWKGDGLDTTARGAFRMRWDALNAKRGYGWAANPWVWAISFERLTAPISHDCLTRGL